MSKNKLDCMFDRNCFVRSSFRKEVSRTVELLIHGGLDAALATLIAPTLHLPRIIGNEDFLSATVVFRSLKLQCVKNSKNFRKANLSDEIPVCDGAIHMPSDVQVGSNYERRD